MGQNTGILLLYRMGTSDQKRDGTKRPPTTSTVILLLGDIVDTSWRMFVPTIGGTLLGWWLGHVTKLGTWLAFVGLLIGCVITFVLIKQQFKKVGNVK